MSFLEPFLVGFLFDAFSATATDWITACCHKYSRNSLIKLASSAKASITIWPAPSKAALASATPNSGLINCAATASGSKEGSSRNALAKGSSPASFAIWALVRRLGRNGKYKSSKRFLLSAIRHCCSNSGVSKPCSRIELITTKRRSSSSLQ